MTDCENEYPTTIESAVRLIQGVIPKDEQFKIAVMTQDELINLHFGLGLWIRNNLGLRGKNPKLMAATKERYVDDASSVIILALWQALRDDLPKIH